jgi:hypothetical protein
MKNFFRNLNLSVKTRVYLLVILLLITGFLFLFNYLGKKAVVKENRLVTDLPLEELKSRLATGTDSILYSYGIKKFWIENKQITGKDLPEPPDKQKGKKNKNQEKKDNTTKFLWFAKDVSIPQDLPTIDMVKEISLFMKAYNFELTSIEEPKTGNVSMDIYSAPDSSKKSVARINFIYSSLIKRDAGEVCVILDSLEAYTPEDLEKVLTSPERFSVIMPDNIDNSIIQSSVNESGRDFLLKFNIGNEDNVSADFRTDMKEKDWKAKVKSLAAVYHNASGIILKNPLKIFDFEGDIIDEFKKNRINAYRDTLVINFRSDEVAEKKVFALFTDILTKSAQGSKRLVYITFFNPLEFLLYEKEIFNIKKRGYKFLSFSDLMKKKENDNMKEKDLLPGQVKKDSLRTAKPVNIKK